MASAPGTSEPEEKRKPGPEPDPTQRLLWMAQTSGGMAHLVRPRSPDTLCGEKMVWRLKPLTIEHRCEACVKARLALDGMRAMADRTREDPPDLAGALEDLRDGS